MIGHLHNGHIQTGVQEVFGHFHANVAAADNDGLFALAESHHLVPDGVGVGDVAQGEDVGGLGALDGRHQGLGAGGENQLVIGFGVLPVLLEIVDGDGLPGTVDGHHLRQHPDVNAEPVVKALRRLQRQGALFGDLTADIVGQTAVGKGDVLAAFQQYNFAALIQTTQAGRSAGAAGHTADNHSFHEKSLQLMWRSKSANGLVRYYILYLFFWRCIVRKKHL